MKFLCVILMSLALSLIGCWSKSCVQQRDSMGRIGVRTEWYAKLLGGDLDVATFSYAVLSDVDLSDSLAMRVDKGWVEALLAGYLNTDEFRWLVRGDSALAEMEHLRSLGEMRIGK